MRNLLEASESVSIPPQECLGSLILLKKALDYAMYLRRIDFLWMVEGRPSLSSLVSTSRSSFIFSIVITILYLVCHAHKQSTTY